jgi:hypothetical protein
MSAQDGATRVLVVANRTASTPQLLDEVANRARQGASFTLIIPSEQGDAAADDWSSETACELLERAAGAPVAYVEAKPDPLAGVHTVVDGGQCDEIILSAPVAHLSRWVHHDLRHRIEKLGMPVYVIPPEPDTPLPDHIQDGLPDDWYSPHPIPGGADAGNF